MGARPSTVEMLGGTTPAVLGLATTGTTDIGAHTFSIPALMRYKRELFSNIQTACGPVTRGDGAGRAGLPVKVEDSMRNSPFSII